MNQTILRMKKILESISECSAALLIGSHGRKEATLLSDIDLEILVGNNFSLEKLKEKLYQEFKKEIRYIFYLESKRKLLIYYSEKMLLIEIKICYSLSDLDQYFLGSEIQDIDYCVLLDRNTIVEEHLLNIQQKKKMEISSTIEQELQEWLLNLGYEIERILYYYKIQDEYRFYFSYQLTLQRLVRIIYVLKKETQHRYLPRRFIESCLNSDEKIKFCCIMQKISLSNGIKKLYEFIQLSENLIKKYIKNFSQLRNDFILLQRFLNEIKIYLKNQNIDIKKNVNLQRTYKR